jgi:hypothetical protein
MALRPSIRWDHESTPDEVLSDAMFYILWRNREERVTVVHSSRPAPDHAPAMCFDGTCLGFDGEGVTYKATSSTGSTFLREVYARGDADLTVSQDAAVAFLTAPPRE